jgi:hypothetical protein
MSAKSDQGYRTLSKVSDVNTVVVKYTTIILWLPTVPFC